jgi:1-deoxy-D-xylulose-5-phosphate reductoisomerase
MRKQSITLLGSTGSIGVSTLDVVARYPDRFELYALTAHSQWQKLAEQCRQYRPKFAVLRNDEHAEQLRSSLHAMGLDTGVLSGIDALELVASAADVDTVVAAIVGAAGLRPTLAAARAGKRILLANKETLVMAGKLFMQTVVEHKAELLPIDSEHNAIFQSLPQPYPGNLHQCGVRRILLTASGGPFRTLPMADLSKVTPEQACAHPNWVMGKKISVDSATMMNKGLEVIEAHWLFNAAPEQIEVVIHPQSVIHSMVDYLDGSVIAQLGNPDMRTPIAHALGFPDRIDSGVGPLDLFGRQLTFEQPDHIRFPCLKLAFDALLQGDVMPAVLNAANEVAVAGFLQGEIRYDQIATAIEDTLAQDYHRDAESLEALHEADSQARRHTSHLLKRMSR